MAPDDIITSTRNPAVADAARLHRARHRRDTGRTLLEGPHLVGEAIASGCEIAELFVLEGEEPPAGHSAPIRVVSEGVMSRLAGTVTPRGPIAVIEIPEPEIDETRPALVAWEISDPGNCGTLLRSAAAFGLGYVSGPRSADPWAPKVLRSAAGAHFRTPVGAVDGLEGLAGRHLVATVVAGGTAPGSLPEDAAILVGSEPRGLPDEVVAACDRLVTIPMPGETESLNAAVAGAVVAYLGAVHGH